MLGWIFPVTDHPSDSFQPREYGMQGSRLKPCLFGDIPAIARRCRVGKHQPEHGYHLWRDPQSGSHETTIPPSASQHYLASTTRA
jgi:hypothetical protein